MHAQGNIQYISLWLNRSIIEMFTGAYCTALSKGIDAVPTHARVDDDNNVHSMMLKSARWCRRPNRNGADANNRSSLGCMQKYNVTKQPLFQCKAGVLFSTTCLLYQVFSTKSLLYQVCLLLQSCTTFIYTRDNGIPAPQLVTQKSTSLQHPIEFILHYNWHKKVTKRLLSCIYNNTQVITACSFGTAVSQHYLFRSTPGAAHS